MGNHEQTKMDPAEPDDGPGDVGGRPRLGKVPMVAGSDGKKEVEDGYLATLQTSFWAVEQGEAIVPQLVNLQLKR